MYLLYLSLLKYNSVNNLRVILKIKYLWFFAILTALKVHSTTNCQYLVTEFYRLSTTSVIFLQYLEHTANKYNSVYNPNKNGDVVGNGIPIHTSSLIVMYTVYQNILKGCNINSCYWRTYIKSLCTNTSIFKKEVQYCWSMNIIFI